MVEVSEKDADEFADINALHGAIARAISLHHFGSGFMNLPTKDGKLDWSLGEATRAIKKSTGADFYATLYAAPQLGFFARHQPSVEQMARGARLRM